MKEKFIKFVKNFFVVVYGHIIIWSLWNMGEKLQSRAMILLISVAFILFYGMLAPKRILSIVSPLVGLLPLLAPISQTSTLFYILMLVCCALIVIFTDSLEHWQNPTSLGDAFLDIILASMVPALFFFRPELSRLLVVPAVCIPQVLGARLTIKSPYDSEYEEQASTLED